MSFESFMEDSTGLENHITIVYGPEGKGKSTFAASYPSPVFLDIENGMKHILGVKRVGREKLPTYKELLAYLNWFKTGKHDRETLVIDSATPLERMMFAHLCGSKYESVADMPYGKGGEVLEREADTFMQLLREVVDQRGVDVIILAHSKIKPFNDPQNNAQYDRFIIQCHEKLAAKLKSYADNVFFLNQEVSTVKQKNSEKSHAFVTERRLIHTDWSHAYDAKKRLKIPSELDVSVNGYQAIQDAIASYVPTASELIPQIKALIKLAPKDDAAIADKKLSEAGSDVETLIRIKDKLTGIVSV